MYLGHPLLAIILATFGLLVFSLSFAFIGKLVCREVFYIDDRSSLLMLLGTSIIGCYLGGYHVFEYLGFQGFQNISAMGFFAGIAYQIWIAHSGATYSGTRHSGKSATGSI